MKAFSLVVTFLLLCSFKVLSETYPLTYANVHAGTCSAISYDENDRIEITSIPAGHTIAIFRSDDPGFTAPVLSEGTGTTFFTIHDIITSVAQGSSVTFVIRETNTTVNPNTTATVCNLTVTNNFIPPPPVSTIVYNSLDQLVYDQYNFGLYFNKKKNLYIKENVVHIFMDEEGRLIITGAPTAIQENYTYQLHVFTRNSSSKISFSGAGEYKPEFLNIQVSSSGASAISSDGTTNNPNQIHEYRSQVFGPYTTAFTLKALNDKSVIFNNTFTPAKRYHLSIVTGLIATNLQNPQNIEIADKAGSTTNEKTLIADDPEWRGMVSVMAVFYPTPRSFLFEPTSFWERTGFIVGTRLNKNAFENLLSGVQFEFARGGSISTGVHFGQRTFVPGYENFKFGEDVYTPTTVVTKKEWGLGWFIGINLDLKIVQYFLSGGTNPK